MGTERHTPKYAMVQRRNQKEDERNFGLEEDEAKPVGTGRDPAEACSRRLNVSLRTAAGPPVHGLRLVLRDWERDSELAPCEQRGRVQTTASMNDPGETQMKCMQPKLSLRVDQ